MTREQERRLLKTLRRATVPALEIPIGRPEPHDGVEKAMDRLWSDKAALGELLRRGFFGPGAGVG